MTLPEFKAWFDGFCESMDGAPSEKQWKRIKARVAEITGTPLTYPVYVDRYVPRPAYPYLSPYYGVSNINSVGVAAYADLNRNGIATAMSAVCSAAQAKADDQRRNENGQTVVWNAMEAMNALGKADAAELAAA